MMLWGETHLIKLYTVYVGDFLEPEKMYAHWKTIDRNDSGFYCICSFTTILLYIMSVSHMQDNRDFKTLKFCLASVWWLKYFGMSLVACCASCYLIDVLGLVSGGDPQTAPRSCCDCCRLIHTHPVIWKCCSDPCSLDVSSVCRSHRTDWDHLREVHALNIQLQQHYYTANLWVSLYATLPLLFLSTPCFFVIFFILYITCIPSHKFVLSNQHFLLPHVPCSRFLYFFCF